MDKPRFVCGSYDVSPEHPSDWDVDSLAGYIKNTTLSGTQVKDVLYRKYAYTLIWDAMSKQDYEDLQELVNYHNDNGDNILFTYKKWPESTNTVECQCDLLSRSRKGGSGNDNYYQTVTITLTEVSSRL